MINGYARKMTNALDAYGISWENNWDAGYNFYEVKQKIESNPDYNPNSETYFQLYDNSQVTEEQIANLDKPIEVYKKIKSAINFSFLHSCIIKFILYQKFK